MASIGPIKVPIDFQMTDTARDLIRKLIDEQGAKIDGELVEIGQVYGKPLYIRDDTHDPEQLRYTVEQIQSAFRRAFYTPEEN